MNTGDWITLAVFAVGLAIQFVAVAWLLGGRLSKVEGVAAGAADGVLDLRKALSDKVSIDQGKALQGQIKSLQSADAACEARLTTLRDELGDRIERQNSKLAKAEETRAAESARLAADMGGMKATLEAVGRNVERLLAVEQQAHPSQTSSGLDFQTILAIGRLMASKEGGK